MHLDLLCCQLGTRLAYLTRINYLYINCKWWFYLPVRHLSLGFCRIYYWQALLYAANVVAGAQSEPVGLPSHVSKKTLGFSSLEADHPSTLVADRLDSIFRGLRVSGTCAYLSINFKSKIYTPTHVAYWATIKSPEFFALQRATLHQPD